MSNVEPIQQATKDFGDAATTSANTFATSLQTIASAHADFAKKLMQHGSEFISQLTSVKEPAKLMELQSEYVRNSYETFVAEAKRISELYADLFKQTTKPLEDLIEKNKRLDCACMGERLEGRSPFTSPQSDLAPKPFLWMPVCFSAA